MKDDKRAVFLLKKQYRKQKKKIISRITEFRRLGKDGSDTRLFEELCFCLLTPQAKAKLCWDTVGILKKRKLLLKGAPSEVSPYLTRVRFKNNKAKNIVSARGLFTRGGRCRTRCFVDCFRNPPGLRAWLVDNVRGMGMKEASHFLRNIGMGDSIAILDRHILKNLARYGVIGSIPKSLTHKTYLEIERRMLEFASKTGIPASHLDLLFWSMETGEVFK